MISTGFLKVFSVMLLLMSTVSCTDTDTKIYLGSDIRRFKGTPAWPLAKALDEGDYQSAKEILDGDHSLIDFQEPQGRLTLLFWAAYAGKLKQFQFIIESGANVNLRNADGVDVITYVSDAFETSEYLRLAIKYGGDVNSYTIHKGGIAFRTPMISAAGCGNPENLKLLVDHGADVNMTWRGSGGNVDTPLGASIYSGFYQNTEFLLSLKKCDLTKPVNYRQVSQDSVYVVQALTESFRYADNNEDSLRIQNLIRIAQAQLDSLKK